MSNWRKRVNDKVAELQKQKVKDGKLLRALYDELQDSSYGDDQKVEAADDLLVLEYMGDKVFTVRVADGKYLITPSSGPDEVVKGSADAIDRLAALMAIKVGGV